jgi:hypothetical protein
MVANRYGNISIGDTDLAITTYKLYISGNTFSNNFIVPNNKSYKALDGAGNAVRLMFLTGEGTLIIGRDNATNAKNT